MVTVVNNTMLHIEKVANGIFKVYHKKNYNYVVMDVDLLW